MIRNGQNEGNTQIHLVSHLAVAQLVTSPVISQKVVDAHGETTTCGELREKSFLPQNPEYYASISDPIVPLLSNFLPPNPSVLCATLFGKGENEGIQKIATRIRAFNDILAKVTLESSQNPHYKKRNISFRYHKKPSEILFAADEIAGDCFHLSAKGQSRLADAMM